MSLPFSFLFPLSLLYFFSVPSLHHLFMFFLLQSICLSVFPSIFLSFFFLLPLYPPSLLSAGPGSDLQHCFTLTKPLCGFWGYLEVQTDLWTYLHGDSAAKLRGTSGLNIGRSRSQQRMLGAGMFPRCSGAAAERLRSSGWFRVGFYFLNKSRPGLRSEMSLSSFSC